MPPMRELQEEETGDRSLKEARLVYFVLSWRDGQPLRQLPYN
jgi:hypothetical protein